MTSFLHLFSVVAVAATASAMLISRSQAPPSACADRTLLSSSRVNVNGHLVEVSTLSCNDADSSLVARSLNLRDSVPASNVCGEICNLACSDPVPLPPTVDDCDVIVDAITILSGSTSPTFVVQPGGAQQLSFGTCTFFFQNLSNTTALTSCWTDLANEGSAAVDDCFPPVHPINTAAFCRSSDNLWEIGATHSTSS